MSIKEIIICGSSVAEGLEASPGKGWASLLSKDSTFKSQGNFFFHNEISIVDFPFPQVSPSEIYQFQALTLVIGLAYSPKCINYGFNRREFHVQSFCPCL
jgi:hypothetical protein